MKMTFQEIRIIATGEKKYRQYNGEKKYRQYNGEKKYRQYNGETKYRQYNGEKKKVQTMVNITKHWEQNNTTKNGSELRYSGLASSSCPTRGIHCVTITVISYGTQDLLAKS